MILVITDTRLKHSESFWGVWIKRLRCSPWDSNLKRIKLVSFILPVQTCQASAGALQWMGQAKERDSKIIAIYDNQYLSRNPESMLQARLYLLLGCLWKVPACGLWWRPKSNWYVADE
ncbi:hypothetical protein OIU78_009978 [Salix suchowensis]|nr:hypothetical protein OIU78_009978 [Salix suchowensis]